MKSLNASNFSLETPPHMWIRHFSFQDRNTFARNTSTHVETTFRASVDLRVIRKHLHTRGDNIDLTLQCRDTVGNTSTHVETTAQPCCRARPKWKHLHTRGDNTCLPTEEVGSSETPPHTWRRLRCRDIRLTLVGNTSTYVETIDRTHQGLCLRRKHLH